MPLLKLKTTGTLRELAGHTFSQAHTKEMAYLIEKLIDAAIEIKDPDTLRRTRSLHFFSTAYYRDGALN